MSDLRIVVHVDRDGGRGNVVDAGHGPSTSQPAPRGKPAREGEVTPARVLVFTHPVYGKLRITDVHPYRIGGEVCGYACTLAQIR